MEDQLLNPNPLPRVLMIDEVTKWLDLPFFRGQAIREVIKKANSSGEVQPTGEEVFKALIFTPLEKVRVVLLGQGPYPTRGLPNGLAFSVNHGVKSLPGSLQNIFKELHDDIGCSVPSHGDLSSWARQGVLLLNTSLTVIVGKSGSHSDIGWDILVKEVLDILQKKDIIYVLWGAAAKKYLPNIHDKSKVIMSAHPSPLSAHHGFFGSKPFSKINSLLGEPPIDWGLD